MRRLFDSYDSSRSGRLGARALLRLVREMVPEASDLALRHLAVSLYLLDVDGDGGISYKEVLQVGG